MAKIVLTVKEKQKANNAGPKAKVDVEHFLTQAQFQAVNFEINQHSLLQKFCVANIQVPRYFKAHHDMSEIVLQYPTYSKVVTKALIKQIKKYKIKLLIIVHDVESLRLHSNQETYIKEELEIFNFASGLVVHNDSMKEWLLKHGVTIPMTIMPFFDYDNPVPVNGSKKLENSVCFAGNLSKAIFLSNLQLYKAKLDVFGPNPAKRFGTNVTYNGQYSPEELPKHLSENFGLVWDGNAIQSCNGLFGEYMKFNSPHKVSLYLSCGIPVIIWNQAALAPYIVNKKIGFSVSSLSELDNELSKMTNEEFTQMKLNALKESDLVRSGYYIKHAIEVLEAKIN